MKKANENRLKGKSQKCFSVFFFLLPFFKAFIYQHYFFFNYSQIKQYEESCDRLTNECKQVTEKYSEVVAQVNTKQRVKHVSQLKDKINVQQLDLLRLRQVRAIFVFTLVIGLYWMCSFKLTDYTSCWIFLIAYFFFIS